MYLYVARWEAGEGGRLWVRERVEWSLCFFFFFLVAGVCVCNKVRHVIEEEEVCYLIYLRGKVGMYFFGFERVLYSISKVRYLRDELTSRYNPSIQMHEFLS